MCSEVFYRNAKGRLNQMISDFSSLISKISPTPFAKGGDWGLERTCGSFPLRTYSKTL